jgi:polygalacturonase
MKRNKALLLFLVGMVKVTISPAQVYNIQNFGAVADGKTINTKAIQRAIDSCGKTGGQVLIPAGKYTSGTLYLRSNMELHIDSGGVLKGSAQFADYPNNEVRYKNVFTHMADGKSYTNKALLFAEGIEKISLTGSGTIDGSGDSPAFQMGDDNTPPSRMRPCLLLIIDSKKIKLDSLHLQNSAYWMQNYLGCDGLEIRNLTIYNQSNYNQDGIDIDAKNVLIENCNIDVDDDGICFKSHDRYRPVQNITVRNCTIRSNCNAIKFGTSSLGGLQNVDIANCTIRKASADHIRHWQRNLQFIGQPVTVISGIALEAVDGADIRNIRIRNIEMKDVQTPIFIVLGNRGRRQPEDTSTAPEGKISGITIQNVTAVSYSKMCSSITAFPSAAVEDVTLENIRISTMGKGTLAEANTPLKENPADYPENRMYGQVYPASGFFIRHAKGIVLKNISLQLRSPDYRPAIILDDVQNSRIASLEAAAPAGKTAVVRVVNGKTITIDNPLVVKRTTPFLQLQSTPQEAVTVIGLPLYKGWRVE